MEDKQDTKTIALIDKLRSGWIQNGFSVRPGVDAKQIESFQARYSLQMPHDLRDYFLSVDGMEAGATDEDLFWFLPLKAVKSIPEELAHFGGSPDYRKIMQTLSVPDRWFVIVDYMICSAVFAIRLSPKAGNTPVLRIDNGMQYQFVASSFARFVGAYLARPLSLL